MLAVLEKIKELPAHKQTGILTNIFGKESLLSIAPLLKELDLLKKNFVLAGDSAKFAGSTQKEFENRSNTTANSLILTKNKMAELAITAGATLLPAFNELLDIVGRGAVAMATFAEANPEVVTAVMYTVSALVAFKVASLAGGYALTIISDVWRLAKGAWAIGAVMCNRATYAMIWQKGVSLATAAGLKVVTVAQKALNIAMANNPIGWLIKGVTVLGAGLALLYNTCEPVRKALDWLWDGITIGLKPVLSMLGTAWSGIEAVWGGIKSIGSWFSSDESKKIELKTTGANHAPEKSTSWFSGWFGDDNEDKGLKTTPAMQTVASSSATTPAMLNIAADENSAGNLPLPSSFRSQMSSPKSTSSNSGSMIMPASINLTINIHGIPDKDMSERVMDSLRSKSSEIERFLGELLKNQERVTFG